MAEMTLQYVGEDLWEVAWNDGTGERCSEEDLRKSGFTDANITVSKAHPEQVFEV